MTLVHLRARTKFCNNLVLSPRLGEFLRSLFSLKSTVIREETSGYHCSKISGSKQSFLTETAICIVERWKKSLGYRFVPESNHAQEYMSTFSLFSVISAGPRFVEIQKPWQPRQRDVTTSLLSRFSAKMHSQPQSTCAEELWVKIGQNDTHGSRVRTTEHCENLVLVVVLILGPTHTD